jgi:glycosyltransferase involved in cell wall biosynthesis
MRILHLLNHTRRLNGHVHAAIDLACAQRELGHEVLIASGGGDFDALLARCGVETLVLNHHRSLPVLSATALRLRRILSTRRIDVVHAHMMTSAVIAAPICALQRVPLITTVHNAFERSAVLMGLGRRVIAVSEAVAASMRGRGVPASRLTVVLNGTIGTARSRGRSVQPADIARPAVVFVGGLHARKGVSDLIAAFAQIQGKHPAARLHIVGGGPSMDEYVAAARQMGSAETIIFHGPKDDPYPYMLAADIFILPSHADPAPLVLSEAREAGAAIIGTRVDGIPQLLEEGEAGILVPARDVGALADAIDRLLANRNDLEMWRARSQTRLDRLTIARVARETLEVYQSAGAR